MEKKYQIFLSSTYEDLRQEREAVAKAILELGDIPVGMEMFSAADEDQWKLIRRQIEQSDYYMVLIAHRYGSMVENISFTEREYDYASEIGVPVLGFIIEATADWPANWIDTDPDVRARLDAFKAKVKSRMVSFWTNANGLNGKVLAALSKQKNLNPRPGWVRADNVAGPEVVAELGRMGKEVVRLTNENSVLRERATVDTHFSLIDAMADDPQIQALIFMYESGRDLPRYSSYVYAYKEGGGGSGMFTGFGKSTLENTGLVLVGGGGRFLRLTDDGVRFAQWLIKKGRKSDFFWTPFGGWDDLGPDAPQREWVRKMQEQQEAQLRQRLNPPNPPDPNPPEPIA
jgi:hypothetical protein